MEDALHAVVDDGERHLAVEEDLDPLPGPAQDRRRPRRAEKRRRHLLVEHAGSRQPRPLLERQHGDRGLVARGPCHAGRGHEAEVCEQLLDVVQVGRTRLGQRLAHRSAEVVAGEEAHGDTALDPHPHAHDTPDRPQRADELPDAGVERGVIAAGGEPGGEVDGHHAPLDPKVAERRPARDRGPQALRALASRRPGEQRPDEAGDSRRGPVDGSGSSVPEEPDVAPERFRSCPRLAGEREGREDDERHRDTSHAPRVPCHASAHATSNRQCRADA
jgi:hypothetical protein